MIFQRVYVVDYLFRKESLDACYRLTFLEDISASPFERRRKYFLKEEQARKFLKVAEKYFRISLPGHRYLLTPKYFKVRSKIRLVRKVEK